VCKTIFFVLVIVLLYGVCLLGQSVACLGKYKVNNASPRSYRQLAEPKFKPINPPVDVMVNPLIKPVREGDLCVAE
jgi:hypothetical protein